MKLLVCFFSCMCPHRNNTRNYSHRLTPLTCRIRAISSERPVVGCHFRSAIKRPSLQSPASSMIIVNDYWLIHRIDYWPLLSSLLSCCLRIGPRYDRCCVDFVMCDGRPLSWWVAEIRYLRIRVISSNVMIIDWSINNNWLSMIVVNDCLVASILARRGRCHSVMLS